MKILHVIASLDPRSGGPVEGVLSSSAVWFRHGHERHILSLDPPNSPYLVDQPAPTIALGPTSPKSPQIRRLLPWLRYKYTPQLTEWLRNNASTYDAVIVNGLWNYASFGTWRGLHRLSVPYFVFTHGMLDPWFNKAYPIKSAFKALFWKLFEHKVLRDARGVLFTCEQERLLAPQSFSPYRAREYVVGYGANDVQGNSEEQRAAFFSAVPEARGYKVLLFLSRIHKKKGVDILIEAFAANATEFPEYALVIAGPDQEGLKAQLEKRATELGIGDRVFWPGMLAGDAKWGAFRAAEFFVLPSHQENFGVVVAEAMALSRPVLITNKVNIWREIEEDGAGLVVNDDSVAFAAGLRKMCLLSEAQKRSFQEHARQCFLRRYDVEDNAMNLLGLIEKLASATPKAKS